MGPVVFASASCCTSLTSISISLSATGWLWISHLICPPSSPAGLCGSSSITTSQHKRAEKGVAPLRGGSSSLVSLLLPRPPSLAWDCLTFVEGWFISSGAPALFRGGTLTGVESRQGDCCKGGPLKRVKSWKTRLENCDTTAKRKAAWGAGRTE